MFIWELKHNLTWQLKDELIYGMKLSSIISAIVKCCLSIYKKMQVTNWVKEKVKFSIIVQIIANAFSRTVTSFFQAPGVFDNYISCWNLSNSLWINMIFITRNLDIKILKLIKKRRCFHHKEREYRMVYCQQKNNIFIITDILNIDDIENVNQKKQWLFSKMRKEVLLFLQLLCQIIFFTRLFSSYCVD